MNLDPFNLCLLIRSFVKLYFTIFSIVFLKILSKALVSGC